MGVLKWGKITTGKNLSLIDITISMPVGLILQKNRIDSITINRTIVIKITTHTTLTGPITIVGVIGDPTIIREVEVRVIIGRLTVAMISHTEGRKDIRVGITQTTKLISSEQSNSRRKKLFLDNYLINYHDFLEIL